MQAETSRADADAVAKLVLSYLQDNPDVDPNEVSVGEPSVVVTDEVDEISIDGQVLTTRSWPVYSQGVLIAFVYAVDSEAGSSYTLSSALASLLTPYVKEGSAVAIVEDGAETVCVDDTTGRAIVVDTLAEEARFCDAGDARTDTAVRSLSDANETMNPEASEGEGYSREGSPVSEVTDVFEAALASASVSESRALYVKQYHQGSDPICWAAAAYQVGHYLTGQDVGKVQDLAVNAAGSLRGDTGFTETIEALRYFFYQESTTWVQGSSWGYDMSDDETRRWIKTGIPFIIRSYASNGDGHSVTADGYTLYADGTMSIRIVNPGPSSNYIVYAISSGGRGTYHFDYPEAAGKTFTWKTTIVCDGWQQRFGCSKWSWINFDGSYEQGWFSKNGNWYWFDSGGYMVTNNCVKLDGKWYHLGPSGAMDTDWYKSPSSGYWYYLGDDGAARTGWHFLNNRWFVFDSGGAMYRGWYQEGSTWYYLRTAPNVPSGGPEGSMLCNGTWTINGKAYRFDSSGACLNP